jgi:radical SAM protein with 4Fe4S-binding SPASM domain
VIRLNLYFLRIGHVRDGIDVSKVRQILDEFVNLGKEECRFCWCLPTCSAGCVLTVMEKGRLSPTARRDACAAHRETTHRTLRSICRVLEKDPHALDYLGKINLS